MLGRTLDDAAGEAFDKGAGCSASAIPAARRWSAWRATATPRRSRSPARAASGRAGGGSARQAFAQGLDFSFAGLKTALLYRLRELSQEDVRARAADLAASYQAAIVDSLIERAERALEQTGLRRLAVGGGVAANGVLRERLASLPVTLHVPPRVLCTDNAAMIASAARYGEQLAYPRYLGLDAYATGERPG